QIFLRIMLPLLAPVLLAGWIYVFVLAVRELGASIFLVGPGTHVLGTNQSDHVGGGRQLWRGGGAGCGPDRSARRDRCRPAIDRAAHQTPRATAIGRDKPRGAKTKPPPGSIREAADARNRRLQAAAARLPNRLRFSFCFSLRGGSLNRRAAVPPRMLCLAFSERKGRS